MHIQQTLKEVSSIIRDILVFLEVTFPAHPDWEAVLDGAAAMVACHLSSVGLATATGAGLLTLTVGLHLTCRYMYTHVYNCSNIHIENGTNTALIALTCTCTLFSNQYTGTKLNYSPV